MPENCEKCAQPADDAAAQPVDSAETPPVCSCETPCTAESMNPDCAVCGADGALPESCEKCAQSTDDTATQPEGKVPEAQPEAALAVLNGEGETVIELNQAYVDNSNDYNFNNFYVTLQGGKTYKLIENLVLDGKFLWVTPSSDSTAFGVTLDLNGHTLTIQNPVSLSDRVQGVRYYYDWQGNTRSEASPIGILVYTTYAESADQTPLTLTLTDSNDAKTGALDVQGTNATGIYVGRNCTLNIEGGTITNSTVTETTPPTGTGVKTVLGTVNMNGGTIENQASGVLLRGGTFDMTNGTIKNCGYLDDNGKPQGDGGVYAYAGYKEASDTTGIKGSNAHSSTLTMSGGTISNCMNVATGGGVRLDGGSMFTMKNGTIMGCKAGEGRNDFSGYSGGGGVYVGDGAFTMEDGTISGCEAVNHGGGVYAVGTFEMKGGTITNCTARAGGGVSALGYNGSVTFTMSGNAEITGCEAVGGCGGGAYIGDCKFTMSDEAKITNCTATEDGGNVKDGDCILIESADYATLDIADSVTISGQITQGFSGIRIDGLGSVKYPYQISTKDELVLFGRIVNGTTDNHIPAQRGACAELTADIDLVNEAWTPIGSDENNAYTGTFDGGGHTISGLSVSGNLIFAGLFGWTKDATIRNLTVSGSVSAAPASDSSNAGGIVAHADGGAIENCGNLCTVGGSTAGGIAGYTNNVKVSACYNAGSISSKNNAGGIIGLFNGNNGIYDCYNIGKVQSSGSAGGIITGSREGFAYNCYNAGTVTNSYGSAYGIGSYVTATNCFLLKGTMADPKATEKSAEEFADGTVLEKLKNGTHNGEDPWADECQYLAAAGKTLPVFKGQGDTHTHDQSSPWEHNETEHWQVCSCGAVFHKAAHSGGEATCTEKAACTTCGNKYGNVLGHDFTVRQYDNDNHWMKCSRCNATTGFSEHTWDSGKKTTSATCTKAGEKIYTCNVCNATKAESIQATGHSWKFEWTSDATHHWHECANDNCDVTDNSKKDGYAEHSGGTATCTKKAVCSYCGQSYGEIDLANHTGTEQWTQTATTHEKKWSCCDTVSVPSENHEWEDGVCSECGYVCLHEDTDKNHICDICGKTISDHKDTDNNHLCDYCGEKISNHTGGKATCKDKAVCEICGDSYGSLDPNNHTNLKHIDAKAATVTEEGNIEYWYCGDCGKYFSDAAAAKEITKADTITAKLPPKITAGDGATVTQGEKKELSFTSDASFADFIRVELDGNTLEEKNYTKKAGSTVITLNSDFVATLSVGEHTLGIVSQSGTATAKFTVKAKPTETTNPQPTAEPQPTAQPQQTAQPQPTVQPTVQPVSPIPSTGDTANPALWFALLIVSGSALAAIVVLRRKSNHR